MCTAIDCTQKSNQHQLQWTIRSNNCLKMSNVKKRLHIKSIAQKKTLPRQTLTHFGPKDFHIGSYAIDIKPHFFFLANRGGSPFQCPIDLIDSVNCRALFYIQCACTDWPDPLTWLTRCTFWLQMNGPKLQRFWVAKVLSCRSFELQKFWVAKVMSCRSFELQKFWVAEVLSCKSFELHSGQYGIAKGIFGEKC